MPNPRWLREILDGYRWLWRAQLRWRPGPRWLVVIRFIGRLIADTWRAALPTRHSPVSFFGPVFLVRSAAIVVTLVAISVALTGDGVVRQSPVETESQVVESVVGQAEASMESLITVWPYELSASALVALPKETRLAVYSNYNGGTARGGDDRLIVVLQDPITRKGFADGFWPVIAWMPLADARQLHGDLALVISSKPLSDNEGSGVESLIGTGMYSLDHNGSTRLSSEAAWRVMPRYVDVDATGKITQVDDRLTVVLADATNSFWPVIVKMDSGAAQTFMADLARVIGLKSEDPEGGGSAASQVAEPSEAGTSELLPVRVTVMVTDEAVIPISRAEVRFEVESGF